MTLSNTSTPLNTTVNIPYFPDVAPSKYASFMQTTMVKAGELEFCVEMGGDQNAPPVVLIMGFGAQLLWWSNAFCQSLIDQGFRVIRFDNRDIGLSSKIKKPIARVNMLATMLKSAVGIPMKGANYTLYDMAEDTHLLIQALGLQHAHVIGGSMGGMIAQILASKYPTSVRSLNILWSSNNRGFAQPPYPKQLLALLTKPKNGSETEIIAYSKYFITVIGSPKYINTNEIAMLARTLYRRSYYPAGVIRQLQAILATGSLVEIDKNISHSTLVVHGSADRLLPPSNGRSIAKYIPNAHFELIKDLGHDIPDHFAVKLATLFAEHMKKNG